jgi:hypothetical protein
LTASYPTRIETRRLNNIARRFTLAACGERRADLDSILDEGVRWLEACQISGMPATFVDEVARSLHDQLSNLSAAIDRDLDEVGEPPAPPLEVGELEGLFLPRGIVR